MNDIDDFWYVVAERSGEVFETSDPEHARIALREGLEVLKTTRKNYLSGIARVRITVTTPIFKIKDV